MTLRTGVTNQAGWSAHSFGRRTPWGDRERERLVLAGESDLERLLSSQIMRGPERPLIEELPVGTCLIREGDRGASPALLLDGVMRIEVAGHGVIAEVGPGATIGERALLEGGRRTAAVTAGTPVRVAVVGERDLDLDRLRELAGTRHREDATGPASE